MSGEVIAYQLFILATVVGAGALIGPKSMLCTALGWSIWTIAMIFSRWLYLLQFATIVMACAGGFSIQESANYVKWQRLARKVLLWLFMVGLVLGVVLVSIAFYFEMNPTQRSEQSTVSAPPAPAAEPPPKPSLESVDIPQPSYAETLQWVEAKYPALNPDHPAYRQELMERVLSSMRSYQHHGSSPVDALLLAVDEMERERRSPPVYAPPQATYVQPPPIRQAPGPERRAQPPERICEYKGVMSDDDYRACGLNPPSTDR